MQKLNSEKENASQKIKQSVGKPLFTLFCIGQALIIIIMIATMIIIDVSAQPLDIPPIEKWQSDSSGKDEKKETKTASPIHVAGTKSR